MSIQTSKIRKTESLSIEFFLERYAEILQLKLLAQNPNLKRNIRFDGINRVGLALSGFIEHFPEEYIQLIGNTEVAYLNQLEQKHAQKVFKDICSMEIPCIVVSSNQELNSDFINIASELNMPLFVTPIRTNQFISIATYCLQKSFAEQISLHGCMVDYHGVGVLITGKSGSGKSETAMGILERGGALIADDLVHIKHINSELIATPPELSRGYIEMRGLGIINVANLFGLGAIRPEKRLDLIVELKAHSDSNNVDRLGLRREEKTILNVQIPHVEILVTPGQETARLISIAALNLQLKRVGYDMAEEFNKRLIDKMSASSN